MVDDVVAPYPCFDHHVPPHGYRWWYIDAISDDRSEMITIIAFVGSVFSPYYKYARDKSNKQNEIAAGNQNLPLANPENYCSINVALYGKTANRWCMTERSSQSISRQPNHYVIGPSQLSYQSINDQHGTLIINLDEITAPLPRRIRGRIEVDIKLRHHETFALDTSGHHQWWPVDPHAKIRVELENPKLQWQGHAYVDKNWGDQPIEEDIDYWCWSRFKHGAASIIHYDVYERGSQTSYNDDPDNALAISIHEDGTVKQAAAPPITELKKTKWRMPRHARSDQGYSSEVKTLEDTPFYSRSSITSTLNGQELSGIHESVSLARFRSPITQLMLPFRMPRRFR